MVENDAKGNAVGYKAGKSIHLARNPKLGCEQGLPSRVSRRDPPADQLDRRQRGRSPRSSRARTSVLDTSPPAQVLKRVVQRQKDQLVHASRRRLPLVHAQHDRSKPLDNLNVRKAIIAGVRPRRRCARRAAATLVGTIATHWIPPGIGGFEEAGGDEGPGLRLPGQARGRHGAGDEVHEGGGLLVRQVRRRRRRSLMVGDNVDPGKADRRGRARRSSRSSASRSSLRTVPHDDDATPKCCQQPAKKVDDLPDRRAGSRTSTTPSRCWRTRSRAARISLSVRQQQPGRSSKIRRSTRPMDDAAPPEGRPSATRPGLRSTR